MHVGPVKTGSTFIQDVLWQNQEDLGRQGVQHPCWYANEMWFAVNDVQDCEFIHFDLPGSRGSWASMVERVHRYDGRSLLSHELMGFSTDQQVDRIVADLSPRPLHIIVHARSLNRLLASTFQEKVKMVDPDISWQDWLVQQRATRAAWCDTAAIVGRWARHVPKSYIHVVTVPPRGLDRSVLLARFGEAAGIDTAVWGSDGAESNASLDTEQTELLRLVNRATQTVADVEYRRALVNQQVLPRLGPVRSDRMRRIDVTHRGWIEDETDRRMNTLASDRRGADRRPR